jgi:cation diffusion facilitator CzcD-associated flavoprotein CzcO
LPEPIDLETVRKRYADERARRLRADGTGQYRYIEERHDPWAQPIDRAAIEDEVDVVLMGAGLSGLALGAMLRMEGVDRICMFDNAGDVGGTWYWNRYPAAQCDVQSYIYLPLLEEMGYMPTERYVYQPEILEYCRSMARKFDLYRDAYFQTEVVDAVWDDDDTRWTVQTNRGDIVRARFVVMAGGALQRPKLPDIPGLEDFRGALFHSSRWDYGYTGGGPGPKGDGLPNLTDKRVGVIGTGATGLQLVTPLAEAAQHLSVFQRTPVVVLPRDNRPTDPAWAATLEPGWQDRHMFSFNEQNFDMTAEDLIDDAWSHTVFPVMASHNKGMFGSSEDLKQAEIDDLAGMDVARARIASIVKNPDIAAALMPNFRMLCKRASFHDDYLESFNRPNVTLVDTKGAGVESATATGVVVAGREYELDCLILATGFDIGRGLLKAWGIDPVGVNGIRMTEYWAKGARTFHGMHVHGFPNLFIHGPGQVAPAFNWTSSVVEMGRHIAYVIATARARNVQRVDATPDAEEYWLDVLGETPAALTEYRRECTPGYFNNEGNVRAGAASNFSRGPNAFYSILQKWRADDLMTGLDVQ